MSLNHKAAVELTERLVRMTEGGLLFWYGLDDGSGESAGYEVVLDGLEIKLGRDGNNNPALRINGTLILRDTSSLQRLDRLAFKSCRANPALQEKAEQFGFS